MRTLRRLADGGHVRTCSLAEARSFRLFVQELQGASDGLGMPTYVDIHRFIDLCIEFIVVLIHGLIDMLI